MRDLLRPSLGALVHREIMLPARPLSRARRLICEGGRASPFDLLLGLAEALPPSLYSGAGIEPYLRACWRTEACRMISRAARESFT